MQNNRMRLLDIRERCRKALTDLDAVECSEGAARMAMVIDVLDRAVEADVPKRTVDDVDEARPL
jgi:hypothetical protein